MSTAASDVLAFSPFPRRHPAYDRRKEGCVDRVFLARFQQSGKLLEMYRLNKRRMIPPKVRISNHWRLLPLMAMDAHPSSSSNRPPPPPHAVPRETAGRTTISKRKKVLDQISCRIQQTEQTIKVLKNALKPAHPGFGRIVASILAAFLVVAHVIVLLAFPTLECFIYVGLPLFLLVTTFNSFVELYPPIFRVEGWLQFGALICCYVSLASACLDWFYSWLTVKD